jgi:CBS domain containing-hemolysin-like protein
MANIVFELVGNLVELTGIVTDVALSGPFAALLVLSSTVVWLVAFGLFAYLVIGGLLSGLIPDNFGRTPPQQGR